MAKRVDIAYYIGEQDLGNGQTTSLWNIIPKNGIIDQKNRITYPEDTTLVYSTLKRIFPFMIWPKNPTPRTIYNAHEPLNPNSIAYAMF